MSKRQYHHGNLREALVEAAILEVAEHGVGALTLRGVARRAGVSQAAPYHHFPSLEALVAELCLRGYRELNTRLRQVVAAIDDPVDQLRAMGRSYIAVARENPGLFKVMFGHYVADKAEYEALRCEAEGAIGVLVQAVARGQALGAFVGDDPVAASLAVWSSVHGASMLLVERAIDYPSMHRLEVTEDRLVEAVVQHCLRAMTAG